MMTAVMKCRMGFEEVVKMVVGWMSNVEIGKSCDLVSNRKEWEGKLLKVLAQSRYLDNSSISQPRALQFPCLISSYENNDPKRARLCRWVFSQKPFALVAIESYQACSGHKCTGSDYMYQDSRFRQNKNRTERTKGVTNLSGAFILLDTMDYLVRKM
jgi:hypothetical protein